MKLRSFFKVATGTLGVVVGLLASACSRDHIEAINLANAGDRLVKVNVAGAIQKYEEATRLDPTNHRIFWKLANAYHKQEEWEKMATALQRAATQAPTFANYHYRRGFALVKIAEAGNPDAYEEAKAPLQECIKHDPNYAECYFWLGQALWWTDDEQGALENFYKAVEHDPTLAYFYPPAADLLLALRLYGEAEKLLKEGTRIVAPTEGTKDHLYNMYTLLSAVYQAKGDSNERVAVLERANSIAGDSHPDIAFNLGSTYAVMKPPNKEKALRLLKSFNKKACGSAKAKKQYKEQCEQASDLVQRLGQ